MITVYTFIFLVLIFGGSLLKSKITSIFLLSYLIKVIFPFYYFSQNSEIDFFADLLAASSLVIITLASISFSGYSKKVDLNIYMSKSYVHAAMLVIPIAC